MAVGLPMFLLLPIVLLLARGFKDAVLSSTPY
jgi:hypothetical protein